MADDIAKELRDVVCWCADFDGVCHACQAADEIERLRSEVATLMDGMEYAWAVIANGQYWDRTDMQRHAEWEQAKFRFRDEHWHPALDRNGIGEARRG